MTQNSAKSLSLTAAFTHTAMTFFCATAIGMGFSRILMDVFGNAEMAPAGLIPFLCGAVYLMRTMPEGKDSAKLAGSLTGTTAGFFASVIALNGM